MNEFVNYYLRGLVLGIVFFLMVAVLVGLLILTVHYPYVGIPVFILVVLPLAFGSLGGS